MSDIDTPTWRPEARKILATAIEGDWDEVRAGLEKLMGDLGDGVTKVIPCWCEDALAYMTPGQVDHLTAPHPAGGSPTGNPTPGDYRWAMRVLRSQAHDNHQAVEADAQAVLHLGHEERIAHLSALTHVAAMMIGMRMSYEEAQETEANWRALTEAALQYAISGQINEAEEAFRSIASKHPGRLVDTLITWCDKLADHGLDGQIGEHRIEIDGLALDGRGERVDAATQERFAWACRLIGARICMDREAFDRTLDETRKLPVMQRAAYAHMVLVLVSGAIGRAPRGFMLPNRPPAQ